MFFFTSIYYSLDFAICAFYAIFLFAENALDDMI